MNRVAQTALIADLMRSGHSAIEVAEQVGCCRTTVYNICHRLGVLPQPAPRGTPSRTVAAVRSVHESMDEPEWAGVCLYRRATAEACRRVATWSDGGECLACDEHKRAMACNVSVRRVRARDEEAESWWA